jgi:hypothetical protein
MPVDLEALRLQATHLRSPREGVAPHAGNRTVVTVGVAELVALLDIVEAAQALVDETLANAGNCPSCGEEDGEHTTDCRFAPLVAALKRLETE